MKIIYKSLKSNNFDREIYTFVDNGKEEYLVATFCLAQLYFFTLELYLLHENYLHGFEIE